MWSTLHWNILWSPLSLAVGLFFQLAWLVWTGKRSKPRHRVKDITMAALACAGVMLVSTAAWIDRDATLLGGQVLVLPLLWNRGRA